ncbi:ribose-phosphate pyrophosphokinase 4-like [Cucumis melo var. makuwa]|uniref:ribose-phosphate diphosphokinase n=2 Tax=Cucumis melo TaxID=3656 RepID=A0A1S3BDX8_CUCME|nr:ribose-phosphate pyrophosphokinase 4-like [Cucumis melo]KAA0034283.1 ribose-phosphate pyrophosphokinase 4-like [Cucumis melo var. makuwa]
MAANRPLHFPFKNPNTLLDSSRNSSSVPFSRTYAIGDSKIKNRIACEIKNFENTYQWTIESVPGTTDSFCSIQNSASISTSVPMAAASAAVAALELTSKTDAKKICLFFCPETKTLAEKIADESDGIDLRSISWRKFEDGFPNIFIPNAQGIRGQHVAFLASFSSPSVIFEQLSVIYALPKLFVSSFTLVLPFFPTGTFERMEDEGDVATAFTLARILSHIPISRGGPTSLVTFDIHALQERFYFGDNILPCFESGIPLLKNRLQQLPDSDNIAIAFPDDGAWKRFHKQLQHFPTIVCAKVREGDQRIVRLKEGEPKGRHVVIVDDLVQSGGTLRECQKVLAAHGAAKISAYVTHGIFPNKSWQRFEHDNGGNPENGLTYFWITDSCPLTVKEVANRAPFEVLSLAGSIAAALRI